MDWRYEDIEQSSLDGPYRAELTTCDRGRAAVRAVL